MFKEPAAGRVILHPTGYHAFIPAPLPPTIAFDKDLVRALSRADAALSELSGVGRIIPNPSLLIGPLVRREAVQSSRIEGTQANLEDVLLDEAAPAASPTEQRSTELREVHNYTAALEHGIHRLPSLPLSLRLVRELHAKLMAGVRGEHATPGEFRRSQNWIGPAGSNLINAAYVPPPVEEMHAALDAWERYLHIRDDYPDLVQCALLHPQFEAIHPFLDGNGRVGRLLITLFLIERGRLSQPLLYLSDFIERHRVDYYELLQRTRTNGDWLPWLRYFLQGVEVTAIDACARARGLLDLRESMLLVAERPLVDQLFLNPYITVGKAAQVLGVTHPTATRELKRLETLGWMTEITKRKWGKVYLVRRILSVVAGSADEPGA